MESTKNLNRRKINFWQKQKTRWYDGTMEKEKGLSEQTISDSRREFSNLNVVLD